MKRLALIALALAVGIGASPAQGRESERRFHIAENKAESLLVSFYVRDGKVRRSILDVRNVPCRSPNRTTRVSTYLDRAKIEDGSFKTRRQKQFDNFVLKGTVSARRAAGTASVKEKNNDMLCRSGKIAWEAERTSFRKWKAFRDIYD